MPRRPLSRDEDYYRETRRWQAEQDELDRDEEETWRAERQRYTQPAEQLPLMPRRGS